MPIRTYALVDKNGGFSVEISMLQLKYGLYQEI